ncbi:hypothetical protein R3P38DRAFT_2808036 [Favolaschia claudopus]|uniref:Uncharacterized protein n=1 Tax=Favolaschia claudopus TaxID=2862362 RepID=A0AAV9ZGT1_9AGAR
MALRFENDSFGQAHYREYFRLQSEDPDFRRTAIAEELERRVVSWVEQKEGKSWPTLRLRAPQDAKKDLPGGKPGSATLANDKRTAKSGEEARRDEIQLKFAEPNQADGMQTDCLAQIQFRAHSFYCSPLQFKPDFREEQRTICKELTSKSGFGTINGTLRSRCRLSPRDIEPRKAEIQKFPTAALEADLNHLKAQRIQFQRFRDGFPEVLRGAGPVKSRGKASNNDRRNETENRDRQRCNDMEEGKKKRIKVIVQ